MGLLQIITRRGSGSGGRGMSRARRWGRRLSFRPLFRAWEAALRGRLNSDWRLGGGNINQELRSQLPIVREKARWLEHNSAIARSYLALVETHVVGPEGFMLQVQGERRRGESDAEGNLLVERAFREWGRQGVCEVSGRLDFVGLCRMLVRTEARDGEALLRMHDVRPTEDNPFGFVLEAIDPARLDVQLNEDRLKNGNAIRLGVELNRNGRPVAYWLKSGENNEMGWPQSYVRVEARDIIHWYEPERPEQLRGVSRMASVIESVHALRKYRNAALVAARAGASKMGFLSRDPAMGALAATADGERDDDGYDLREFEPGQIDELPPGVTFQGWDPKYPHENFEPFVRAAEREIAIALGVSYHSLAGDLTEVNYSSIRTGSLEERDRWRVRQEAFAAAVLRRVYRRWLNNAALNGQLGVRLSLAEQLRRYARHRWQGRRWSWVDPEKDIKATVMAINAGLTSPQRVASEMGLDYEEVLDQIARWQETADAKGVRFPVVQNAGGNEQPAPQPGRAAAAGGLVVPLAPIDGDER